LIPLISEREERERGEEAKGMRKGGERERERKSTGVESFVLHRRSRSGGGLYYSIDDADGKVQHM